MGVRGSVHAAATGGSILGPQSCPESLKEEDETLHQPPAEARPAFPRGEEPEGHGRKKPFLVAGKEAPSDGPAHKRTHVITLAKDFHTLLVSQSLGVTFPQLPHRYHHDLLISDVPVSRQLQQPSWGHKWGMTGDPGDIPDMQFTVPPSWSPNSHLSPVNSEGCCKAVPMHLLGTSPPGRGYARFSKDP